MDSLLHIKRYSTSCRHSIESWLKMNSETCSAALYVRLRRKHSQWNCIFAQAQRRATQQVIAALTCISYLCRRRWLERQANGSIVFLRLHSCVNMHFTTVSYWPHEKLDQMSISSFPFVPFFVVVVAVVATKHIALQLVGFHASISLFCVSWFEIQMQNRARC